MSDIVDKLWAFGLGNLEGNDIRAGEIVDDCAENEKSLEEIVDPTGIC